VSRASVAWVAAAVAIAAWIIAVALGTDGAPQRVFGPSTSERVPAMSVTIDSPVDGTSTSARSMLVTGRAPAAPRGGGVWVTVTVNGRPVRLEGQGDTYRAEVALELGGNELTAKAEIYTAHDEDPTTITSAPTAVARTSVPGDGTGTLDLATAAVIAEWSDYVYWLCGESDDCGTTKPRCFQVGPRRVDCPVGDYGPAATSPVALCALVITVHLRDRHVYYASYGCRGRRLNPSPERFVRRTVYRRGRQFRVDEAEAPHLRQEINQPNRYGVPRFDVDSDRFLP
jgi:hypothetical protein